MSDLTDKAEEIITGKIKLPEGEALIKLIKGLKNELEYGFARKILTMAAKVEKDPVLHNWIKQQLALCTYKDEELQPFIRFREALTHLNDIGLLSPDIKDSETLALGGAVYKRKWEFEGQIEHLYSSLAFYSAAWERNPERDMGYGGANAAYILDLLASRNRISARRTSTNAVEADSLSDRAKRLREEMKEQLPEFARQIKDTENRDLNEEYWYIVTLAEIHFGLKDYPSAEELLTTARDMDAKEWERETTFRQLVNIAMLHGESPPEDDNPVLEHPWKALSAFFKEGGERAFSCARGKVGLALSGGGFRASFYHLGVLARLAEMDVLRSVEVLSTVSGGSILGALYYLEVRNLLETREDKEITKDDYLEIVKRIQDRFLEGVQENLRTMTVSSFKHNWKMIFSKEYSRSHRIGELYEDKLYNRIGPTENPVDKIPTMPDLKIEPAGNTDNFKPRYMNWRRRAKVPVLLLNTTSLNTGHSWHFTASWMGESPGLVDDEIGMIGRYRRLYYWQARKDEHNKYPLGYAVAASACVPGLFDPLPLEGLYPGKTVQLVDGGVHDNQGVQGLLDEVCTLVLCSDASGQMDEKERPSDNVLGVSLRSNSILMDRVRETEYQNLQSRVESSALKGLFFVHLKKDLAPQPIDWIKCQDPTKPSEKFSCTTDYGIDKELQRKLAAVRTDLDSFTEVEAYSLMLSGYLMTEYEFKKLNQQHKDDGKQGTWGDFSIDAPRSKDWRFLELENILRQPPKSTDARRKDIGKQLDAASSRAFKIWKLDPKLKMLSFAGGIAVLIALGWFLHACWNVTLHFPDLSVSSIALFILALIAGILFPVIKWLKPEKAMRSWLWKLAAAVAGCIVSNIHLKFFDSKFIKRGSLERLLKLK